MTGASARGDGASRHVAPDAAGADGRRPRRGAARAHAARGGVRFRRARRGAVHGRRPARGASRRRRARPVARCAGSSTAIGRASVAQSGGAARDGPRRRDAGRRLGPAADGRVPRAQLALLRRSRARSRTRRSTRRWAARITARSAASRRRSRPASRWSGIKEPSQQLPLLEPGAGRRRDRPARQRSTACATSSSPTRCSC